MIDKSLYQTGARIVWYTRTLEKEAPAPVQILPKTMPS